MCGSNRTTIAFDIIGTIFRLWLECLRLMCNHMLFSIWLYCKCDKYGYIVCVIMYTSGSAVRFLYEWKATVHRHLIIVAIRMKCLVTNICYIISKCTMIAEATNTFEYNHRSSFLTEVYASCLITDISNHYHDPCTPVLVFLIQ